MGHDCAKYIQSNGINCAIGWQINSRDNVRGDAREIRILIPCELGEASSRSPRPAAAPDRDHPVLLPVSRFYSPVVCLLPSPRIARASSSEATPPIMVNIRDWLPGHSVASHKASYHFCEQLGKGGFGHVTRARTRDNTGEVAIKKVPKQYVRGALAT
jgi:hypothetical protein